MLNKIFLIVDFLFFLKLFLFWLWLWQLKEYHLGRFFAHFQEGQAVKKILSSFWRIKYPKFTKKIILIFLTGSFFALFLISKGFYLPVYFLIAAVPLLFQAMTFLWRKGYLKKAKNKREAFKNLLVIGITGSYGKTSTKEFLYEILSAKFGKNKVLKTNEHQNSEVGIARCILNDLKPQHEIFICEMGAYGRGGIKLLCDIAKPKIGILTGINEQHLATFGSLENIIKTKYELIESLPENGVAVMNWDNEYIKSKVKSQKSKLQVKNQKFYSADEKTDVWAENIIIDREFVGFKCCAKDGDAADFRVNLVGGLPNVLNILGAAACAKELRINLPEIASICAQITSGGAIKLIKNKNGLDVLDSTYSANPDGVISALEYLKTFSGQPFDKLRVKKIIVMPCLIELGQASAEIHRKIGGKIAEVCDPAGDASRPYGAGLAIITTKDRFNELKEGFLSAGGKEEHILFLENPKEIFEKIKNFCKAGDTILLESRVPKEIIRLLTG